MEMCLQILYGIAGIALLYYGAEFLIKGGVSIALKLKVSALLIGLTLVAFGTSFPELVVSVNATIHDSGDISIGNVVGSNICNIALILGLCSLISPMPVHKQLLKFDIWLMLGAAVLFVLFYGISGGINRLEAGVLLTILLAYTVGSFFLGRKAEASKSADEKAAEEAELGKIYPLWLSLLFVAGGFAGLIFGAKWFVNAAVFVASALGVSQAVIGLTIVSLGTSLPELATSVVAAIKKEQDIAIGNVVGSNIFNVLCILGIAPLIKPIYSPGISWIDMGLMVFVSVALIPLMAFGMKLTRWKGVLLFLVYIGYTIYLFCK